MVMIFLDAQGDDGEGTAGPKFGHLHVVFRDWNYQGTAVDVSCSVSTSQPPPGYMCPILGCCAVVVLSHIASLLS